MAHDLSRWQDDSLEEEEEEEGKVEVVLDGLEMTATSAEASLNTTNPLHASAREKEVVMQTEEGNLGVIKNLEGGSHAPCSSPTHTTTTKDLPLSRPHGRCDSAFDIRSPARGQG